MRLATEKGKKFALEKLEERRKKNEDIERVDDETLPAGSSMHFYCKSCGEVMTVPENYTTAPTLCKECKALKDCGWLE